MKRKKLVICNLILLMIMFGVYAVCSVSNNGIRDEGSEIQKDEKQEEITNRINYGNIRLNGLVAQAGEWIYYANREDKDHLYRKNIKNNIVEKLNSTSSDYLNIYGDKIFYRQAKKCNISKMNLDGSDSQIIYKGVINGLVCHKGKLYFVENLDAGGTALIEFDPGKMLKKVLYTGRDFAWPVIDGNQIYFVGGEKAFGENYQHALVCLDNQTGEIKLVCKGWVVSPILDQEKIYYIDVEDRSICSVDVSNKFRKKRIYKFPGLEARAIVKEGDYIYFADYEELIRVSLNTGDREVVLSVEGTICSFVIVKNAIYVEYSMKDGLKIVWRVL